MDTLIFKKKEVEKIEAIESFEKLPVPKIKTDLKNNNKNLKNKSTKKKKYLDTILTKPFIISYFKKRELKIKNQKLNTK